MITAEFVGGPVCGEQAEMHAAMWLLYVRVESAGQPALAQRHRYRLRAGTELGVTTGHVYYDYDGRKE